MSTAIKPAIFFMLAKIIVGAWTIVADFADAMICVYVVHGGWWIHLFTIIILGNSGKPKFQRKCQVLAWEFVEIDWEIKHLNNSIGLDVTKSLHAWNDRFWMYTLGNGRERVKKSCKCLFSNKSIRIVKINVCIC